ncbi:MAG: glycosyltransferase family 4 protein [Bacteroidetes bacterium]|nr:glycosyltransferase family 4 protein [Bacteroidota bacterium]
MDKTIVIGIYSHPEAYPPTLSAINLLANRYSKVVVVCRNTLPTCWEYPPNVSLVFTTRYYFNYEIENISALRKIGYFLRFAMTLLLQCRKYKAETLLCYDAVPLMAAYILKKTGLLKHSSLWYHNHDTIDPKKIGKYSLLWFAFRTEKKAFDYIRLFTLPAAERCSYFPMDQYKGKTVILPNYPSLNIFQTSDLPKVLSDEIRLVYQGSLGPFHGFEEIIPLLNKTIAGKSISLTLIGKMRPGYREKLEQLARQYKTEDKLFFVPLQPYVQLPAITAQYHIGLATHRPYNVTYSTGGTASNKIFEYAACSLPVILYDHDNYRKHLGNYPWTFFTNLEPDSLTDIIGRIAENYAGLSQQAKATFLTTLNFEKAFEKILYKLINGANAK